MRQAKILYKDEAVGLLTQHDNGSFTFSYDKAWRDQKDKPSISLTLPKTKKKYHDKYLFPFFFNMLPEGTNKQTVCKHHEIDEDDYFGLLIITAKTDNIGAVNVIKL